MDTVTGREMDNLGNGTGLNGLIGGGYSGILVVARRNGNIANAEDEVDVKVPAWMWG